MWRGGGTAPRLEGCPAALPLREGEVEVPPISLADKQDGVCNGAYAVFATYIAGVKIMRSYM